MDCSLGEIRLFAGNYATPGWAICNGSTLPIAGNEPLYSLLGTTYGGDGKTTFGLPNLIGKVPVGTGKSTAPNGSTYAIGMTGGATTITVTDASMPAHTHNFNAAVDEATTGDPNNAYYAQSNGTGYPDVKFYSNLPSGVTQPNVTLDAQAVSYNGGSQPHDNRMPYTGMVYIICTQGLYPSFS